MEGKNYPALLLSQRHKPKENIPFKEEITERGLKRLSLFGFVNNEDGDRVFTLCENYHSDSEPPKKSGRPRKNVSDDPKFYLFNILKYTQSLIRWAIFYLISDR